MHRSLILILALSGSLALQPLFADANAMQAHPACVSESAPLILTDAATTIDTLLKDLDRDLAATALTLSTKDLQGPDARTALSDFLTAHANLVDNATLSPQGTRLLVEPAGTKPLADPEPSDQAQVQTLMLTRQPMMSSIPQSVAGEAAVALIHPVSGPDGQLLGAVSARFRPEAFIGPPLADLLTGLPVEIWVMQPDGRILYDDDHNEIGRLLLSDPAYQPFPALLDLGRRIAAEPQGCGAYAYHASGTNALVHKDAWWVSLTLHGTAWRLVSIHPAPLTDAAPAVDATPFSQAALRALAGDQAMIHDLRQGRQDAAMERFRAMVTTHAGIYSLSWVDARAVNRFGFPKNDSLFDVDLRTQTDTASVAIVQAVEHQREDVIEAPLLEGGIARYHLAPVVDGETYLGSLLWIQRL